MRFWNNVSPRNNIEIANKYMKRFFKKPLLSEARKANERWLNRWRIHLQCGRPDFDPWVEKIPWRRAWQPTPVFLPGKCPWTEKPGGATGHGVAKSQTMTERLSTHNTEWWNTAQTGRRQARWPPRFSAIRPQAIEFSFQLAFKKEKQGCHGGVHIQKFRLGNPGTRVSRSLDCTTEPGPTAKVSWSESPGIEAVSCGRDGHRRTSGWFRGEASTGSWSHLQSRSPVCAPRCGEEFRISTCIYFYPPKKVRRKLATVIFNILVPEQVSLL